MAFLCSLLTSHAHGYLITLSALAKTLGVIVTPISLAVFRLISHPLLHAGLSRRILDDLVRPHQYIRRNRQSDLFGGFEIDDVFELCRLLDGQICRLGTFENLVDIY